MKFKIQRSIFFKSLSHLQGIVDKRNSLPILANILIEAKNDKLILSSTDMDISIVEKINCQVLEDGSTTINSQILYDIVRKIDEMSQIEIISNLIKDHLPLKKEWPKNESDHLETQVFGFPVNED